ncbi:hypothetical protein TNCV_3271921 [Trichonephila clavipes]|nr:hypothetical protein TNCV_3271921 [Trichonephila clavipes]
MLSIKETIIKVIEHSVLADDRCVANNSTFELKVLHAGVQPCKANLTKCLSRREAVEIMYSVLFEHPTPINSPFAKQSLDSDQ